MNILFVTGDFAKNERDTALGGMAFAVYKSALGMMQLGHNICVLAVDVKDRKWKYQGIDVISIKAQKGIEEKKIFLSNLYDILKRDKKLEKMVQKLHEEKAIDIIQYTGWFGIGLLHSSNIPAVMRVSSYTKVQLLYNYQGLKKLMFEFVEYLAAKRMNFIFAPSKIMANSVEKDIRKKVAIIETPFVQNNIKLDDRIWQTKLRRRKYILFFGRMSVDKGILVIKDVLYRVLDKYKEIYFVFAGNSFNVGGVKIEDELINASKNYRKRVVFLGVLPKSKLIPVIQHSEMILLPSLADNFPNSCAEAMSLGKIVIGTKGSSLEQYIKDGENGLLADIGDADSLCNCIIKVLSMDEKKKMYISKQAEKRTKELNLEQYSRKMEKLYEKIIGKQD